MIAQTSSVFALNLKFTKLSRTVALLLIVGYLVQLAAPSSLQYLALVPGRFIPCVWNIFTCGFLENSLWRLLLHVTGVLLLARIIEPVWGSKEFLKFITIVNLGTGAATLAMIYVAYTMTRYKERSGNMLYLELSGFHGIFAGCLVAVKQIMPENEVVILSMVKFQAKHLPGIYVLLAVASSISFGGAITVIPFVVFGTVIAWTYLRFMQGKAGLNLRGDPSNEFRFASFFPTMLHPVVDQLADICSRVLRISTSAAGESSASAAEGVPLPGSDSADATRRSTFIALAKQLKTWHGRERGARVLEERLTTASQSTRAPDVKKASDVEAAVPVD